MDRFTSRLIHCAAREISSIGAVYFCYKHSVLPFNKMHGTVINPHIETLLLCENQNRQQITVEEWYMKNIGKDNWTLLLALDSRPKLNISNACRINNGMIC